MTSATLENIPYHVAYAGSDFAGELSEYFRNAVSFFPQQEGSLGARMKHACLHLRQKGYRWFIVIGCDCPERREEDIIETAEWLTAGTDVVLGPVEDGGYHLAGVNESGLIIFDATQWSTPRLLKETIGVAEEHNLRLNMLRFRHDIDTIEDYRAWKNRS